MSKEQTPITAEEWLKQRRIDNGNNHNWEAPYINPLTSELMEQYAQAKVLEALERERKRIWNVLADDKNINETAFTNEICIDSESVYNTIFTKQK